MRAGGAPSAETLPRHSALYSERDRYCKQRTKNSPAQLQFAVVQHEATRVTTLMEWVSDCPAHTAHGGVAANRRVPGHDSRGRGTRQSAQMCSLQK